MEHSFTGNNDTPLTNSVRAANLQLFNLLLKHGALLNSKRARHSLIFFLGQKAHSSTADQKSSESEINQRKEKVLLMLDTLISRGVDVNAVGALGNIDFLKRTYLNFISGSNFTKLIEKMISLGADVNFTPDFCNSEANAGTILALPTNDRKPKKGSAYAYACGTPLLNAVAYGNTTNVKILINSGADVDKSTRHIQFITPLMIAAIQGNVETVDILLKHGADPTLRARAPIYRKGSWFSGNQIVGYDYFQNALEFAEIFDHEEAKAIIINRMNN